MAESRARRADQYQVGALSYAAIQGGPGPDTFHTFSGAGLDKVIGFSAAKGDHIQVDPGTHYMVSQVGADTVVDMGDGDQMILVGVQTSALPAGWIFGA